MSSIEDFIEILRKKRTIREKQFANEEIKQIAEYNDLMNKLKTVKDELNNCKENIGKNLQHLTTHKHSISKLIQNADSTPRLPITHDYHRQAIMFLSEGTDFINKLQSVYKNCNNNNKKNNINPTNLLENITSCANRVGNELYKIKSLITDVKTLQTNVDMLQECCLVNNDLDEDIEI
ncbi:uncharacterized protein LOC143424040 [Xylocopa sonorina]|uniref:uncharacterized protein LOC143424040 n=1 Tax=Xylocopa sonorina TaxID=1818115 RepID=UPI00403A8364